MTHTKNEYFKQDQKSELLNDKDFEFISNYAKINFGLHITASKKPLINSRLLRRFRKIGIKDFKSYREVLIGPDGNQEKISLLSTLTTNVTGFFREGHHFDYLRDRIIPEISKDKNRETINIWSAGCSTGQEPYSIAMTVLDTKFDARSISAEILASDIDPAVLSIAQEGVYNANEISGLPEKYKKDFVKTGPDNKFLIAPNVRSKVRFEQINLTSKIFMQNKFDIIFCRNVTIYFDKKTQEKVWEQFENFLRPGGIMFIGHSERISGRAEEKFSSVGTTTYKKKSL